MKMSILSCSALIICMALLNCESGQVNQQAVSGDLVTAESLTGLEGVKWQLTKMVNDNNTVEIVKDSEITIQFTADHKVAGKSSVNQYFGEIQFDENSNLIWPEPGFGSTMMAGPPELMAQESLYLDILRKTDQIYLNKSVLTFQNQDNSIILEFQKKSAN